MTYLPRRPPQLRTHALRGLQFQLYDWPSEDPDEGDDVPTILLHGWGDSGATWQFVIDALDPAHSYLAFDARGFGRTQHAPEGYWFPDYYADLDALLEDVAPGRRVDLVGHSMGGAVALMYAGIRPQRVRRVVNLDSFGLPPTDADEAPQRYARWLDELRHPAAITAYSNIDDLIAVLARRHPRTPRERLEFIAHAWAQETGGRVQLRADPRHKRINPVLYQRDQAEACWRAIEAQVLFVMGARSPIAVQTHELLTQEALARKFRHVELVFLQNAGHMLHHEQPAEVAALIERFLHSQ